MRKMLSMTAALSLCLGAALGLQAGTAAPAAAQTLDNEAIGSCNEVEIRGIRAQLAEVGDPQLRSQIQQMVDRAVTLQDLGQLVECGELLTEARQMIEEGEEEGAAAAPTPAPAPGVTGDVTDEAVDVVEPAERLVLEDPETPFGRLAEGIPVVETCTPPEWVRLRQYFGNFETPEQREEAERLLGQAQSLYRTGNLQECQRTLNQVALMLRTATAQATVPDETAPALE